MNSYTRPWIGQRYPWSCWETCPAKQIVETQVRNTTTFLTTIRRRVARVAKIADTCKGGAYTPSLPGTLQHCRRQPWTICHLRLRSTVHKKKDRREIDSLQGTHTSQHSRSYKSTWTSYMESKHSCMSRHWTTRKMICMCMHIVQEAATFLTLLT